MSLRTRDVAWVLALILVVWGLVVWSGVKATQAIIHGPAKVILGLIVGVGMRYVVISITLRLQDRCPRWLIEIGTLVVGGIIIASLVWSVESQGAKMSFGAFMFGYLILGGLLWRIAHLRKNRRGVSGQEEFERERRRRLFGWDAVDNDC